MSTAEIAAQIEALKQQMAAAKQAESAGMREKAVSEAKAKGQLLVAEADKAATALVEGAKAKALAMVQNAMARAASMLERAEKGLAFDSPANPSRPKKGRVLPDGRVVPLGRGKPSGAWTIVDLDSVDPSLIVAPEIKPVPVVLATATPATPVVEDPTAVTFVLKGSGQPREVIANER